MQTFFVKSAEDVVLYKTHLTEAASNAGGHKAASSASILNDIDYSPGEVIACVQDQRCVGLMQISVSGMTVDVDF
jgi:hypothetical protein